MFVRNRLSWMVTLTVYVWYGMFLFSSSFLDTNSVWSLRPSLKPNKRFLSFRSTTLPASLVKKRFFYRRIEEEEEDGATTTNTNHPKIKWNRQPIRLRRQLQKQETNQNVPSTRNTESTKTKTTTTIETNTIPSQEIKTSPSSSATTTKSSRTVRTVEELHKAILDDNLELSQINVQYDNDKNDGAPPATFTNTNVTVSDLLSHDVIQLIKQRFLEQSVPGHRSATDTAKLALCIEGGGMRGAVSAGMAAAIACLGLTDAIDIIYGSSAGSVIGSYMVSRQMCVDIYVDILPAAKDKFVCIKRLLSSITKTAFNVFLTSSYAASSTSTFTKNKAQQPSSTSSNLLPLSSLGGMNISFVIDGIMDTQTGIRPLDIDSFIQNNEKQPLKIASSYVLKKNSTTTESEQQQLFTKCFGTDDFFGPNPVKGIPTSERKEVVRDGLFACLEAGMTVPGATGPPVPLLFNNHDNYNQEQEKQQQQQETGHFFDAFCFEPLPYRTAIYNDNVTHALVLCSRPDKFQPKTKPTIYETIVAPNYFNLHKLPSVATFFKKGGQQYKYLEDMMTLEEGKMKHIIQKQQDNNDNKDNDNRVLVPPPTILYGLEEEDTNKNNRNGDSSSMKNRKNWKKASLLPLKVPYGTPELGTLEQGKEEVLQAVRGGFAAAFDLLAPAIGLHIVKDYNEEGPTREDGDNNKCKNNPKIVEMSGARVAELVFPDIQSASTTTSTTTREGAASSSFSSRATQAASSFSTRRNNKKTINSNNAAILEQRIKVIGDAITVNRQTTETETQTQARNDNSPRLISLSDNRELFNMKYNGDSVYNTATRIDNKNNEVNASAANGYEDDDYCLVDDEDDNNNDDISFYDMDNDHLFAKRLLSTLPGLQNGKMNHLGAGLKALSSTKITTPIQKGTTNNKI